MKGVFVILIEGLTQFERFLIAPYRTGRAGQNPGTLGVWRKKDVESRMAKVKSGSLKAVFGFHKHIRERLPSQSVVWLDYTRTWYPDVQKRALLHISPRNLLHTPPFLKESRAIIISDIINMSFTWQPFTINYIQYTSIILNQELLVRRSISQWHSVCS